MLYFSRGSKKQSIPKHAYLTVPAVYEDNLTEVRLDKGRKVSMPLAEARKG